MIEILVGSKDQNSSIGLSANDQDKLLISILFSTSVVNFSDHILFLQW